MSGASESERKVSAQHTQRSRELMISIKSLLQEWCAVTSAIKKPPKDFDQEVEAFIQMLQQTKTPSRSRRQKSPRLQNRTELDGRIYSTQLDPPPKKITEERRSQQPIRTSRRQTIASERPPELINSPTRTDLSVFVNKEAPSPETVQPKKKKKKFLSLSRSKSLQISRTGGLTPSKRKLKTKKHNKINVEKEGELTKKDLAAALDTLQAFGPCSVEEKYDIDESSGGLSDLLLREMDLQTSKENFTAQSTCDSVNKEETAKATLDFDVIGLEMGALSLSPDISTKQAETPAQDKTTQTESSNKGAEESKKTLADSLISGGTNSPEAGEADKLLEFDVSGLDVAISSTLPSEELQSTTVGGKQCEGIDPPLDFDLSGLDFSALPPASETKGQDDLNALVASLDIGSVCNHDDNEEATGKANQSQIKSQHDVALTQEKTKQNKEQETSAAMSYDDFMAALSGAPKEIKMPSPRGDDLIRGIGAREDMNRRGMKKIKKRSITTGRKKGVYQMEDVHYIGYPFENKRDLALLAVFDGHAEKECAETAKRVFPELLSDYLQNNSVPEDCNHLFQHLFLETDKKLIQYETEGTTATAVLIWKSSEKRFVQSANVGDSTTFLCRNGKAIALSIDHKVDNPAEIRRMKDAGMKLNSGQNRINGLALARTLGDHFIKEKFPGVIADPFVSPVYELGDGDNLLILASDGLWDVIDGQQALEMIQRLSDPQEMAAKLINYALNSGKCTDNITVIVVAL